jgi:CheY-like chemotaxis protein/HPt (histidine-containing phosphotransfer) domain-containing protein
VDGRVGVEFEVRDTGIGIKPEAIDRIYGPFFTGKHYQRGTPSSGLGLSIVQKAVEIMQGTIACESVVGVGTTFRMQLSLAVDTSPARAQPQQPLVATPIPARPARILLVEDNEANAMIVEDMLEETPHSVARASGGLQAVRMATVRDFDIILMDISMPDMDGLTACRRIRDARGHDLTARIIALTANAIAGDRERFLANGFDGYLPKPIRQATLIAAIDEMLASGRLTTDAVAETAQEQEGPGIDQRALREFITERGHDRAGRMLDIFGAEVSRHRDTIEEGHAAGSIDKVQRGLHSLVGMGGSVGAKRLATLAKAHEAGCRDGILPTGDEMAALMAEIALVVEEAAIARRALSRQAA